MRSIFFLFSVLLFFFGSLQLTAQGLLKIEQPIRVISYNVRFDNPADRSNAWENRKERLANVLRFHDPDIFCLQEPLINQVEYLQSEFPNFDFYGVGREDGETGGEMCPVFYNRFRFTLLDKGTFWLSETPEKTGSTGWYANIPRIVSWVKLKDFESAKAFFVFNTHFDHESQQARENSVTLIVKKMNELGADIPVVLTGDLNARPESKAYSNITITDNVIQMRDAYGVPKYPHHGPTFTFVGWDFIGVPGRRIDYIFVNSKIDITYHAILTDNWDGVYASDHLPVFIEMKIK